MTSPTDALVASGLTKRFAEREAVSNLSFRVPTGRAFGLLGPNGSGKTTTVRMLTGLLRPTGGTVTLFGQRLDTASADALRGRIGVQTDTNLYESLSVRDNLQIWGELYGLAPAVVRQKAGEVLEVLGLSERVDSLVGQLSKGMRQKLSVGRAVLHEPDLLFLDEPTAGLDPEASADLIDYLKEMIRTLNTTLIICTHQLHGLESLCDELGIIRQGRLVITGEVQSLLRRRWPEKRYRLSAAGDPAAVRAAITAVIGAEAEVVVTGDHCEFAVPEDEAISRVIARLVRDGLGVRAVVPQYPTIQDLYFATLNDGSPS
ncbi:ABC transporter ATP-binding protein [Klugiella xanthotipulae]|uniref:ABC-2 type transport system ATP-binding protein n=1 Tax=Klugiella xanthotipulae TaxID=244735 RepID=A0A543I3U4_9MICO|nr:ABC transporter ATP-binding protein [Klugiella xanthotipulae]TQM65264.1 ABC-2 type transport system ATP-binding protein [Klugiella xanthotipulae]